MIFFSFAHNQGAIAGLTVGVAAIVGFAILWLVIARRRRAEQRKFDASQLYGARAGPGDYDVMFRL